MNAVHANTDDLSEGHAPSRKGYSSGDKATNFILVVDADAEVRKALTAFFKDHALPVHGVASRNEAVRYTKKSYPALIILDVNLDQNDGLDVLRDIRSYSDVPVIITDECQDGGRDRVVGFELGADAYICKPYNLRELVARVRAVLRREAIGRNTRPVHVERRGYRFDGWQLEGKKRLLIDPKGNVVALSRGEYTLLIAFLEAPQRSLTRDQLIAAIRVHSDISDRSIDVLVMRLRRKLEIDINAPQVIRTQRGIGYVFTMDVVTL